MKLTITKKAQSSADKIKKYIEKDNPTEAINVIEKFAEEMEIIQMFPNSGISLNNRIDKPTDLKYKIVYSYAIIYEIANDEVIILNILHLKRDFNKIKFWLWKGVNEDMENVNRQPVYVPGFDFYVVSKVDYNQFLKDREDAERYRKLKREQETMLLREIEKGEEDYKNGRVMTLQELREKLNNKF